MSTHNNSIMNKTEVISNLTFEDIPKSYSWTGSRGTFPPNWWSEILFDFLYTGMNTGKIEEKYRTTLPRASKTDNKSNNMYISVLLRRLLLTKESKGILKSNSDLKSVQTAINSYVTDIIEQATEKYNNSITKGWKEQIERWNEYVERQQEHLEHKNKPSEVEGFINRSLDALKTVNYTFSEIDTSTITNTNINTEDNREEIGKIGEQIVHTILINKYGMGNVVHTASFAKYAEYDFVITDKNGDKRYIEVKSSTRRNRMNWYISRKEYEFYKKNKPNYDLFFVKNVYISKKPNETDVAFVQQWPTPEIIVHENTRGLKDGSLLVTPSNYIGMI